MKKLNTLFLFVLSILFTIILSACVSTPNTSTTQNIEFKEDLLTFEELVQSSHTAVVAEYIETIEYENYIEQKFKVIECLYGDITDNEIYLYSNIGISHVNKINYTYELGRDVYDVDTKYILVMEKITSILYDHDRYMLTTDVLINIADNEYTMYSKPIDIPVGTSIKDYICSIYNSVPHPTLQDEVTSYKNEVYEMVGESSYVGIVKILELVNEGKVHNGNTYRCIVESLSKGSNLNTYGDGTILLVILKNTVELNKSYIIGFSPVGENSLIYTQTTSTSVYDVSDKLLNSISETLTN